MIVRRRVFYAAGFDPIDAPAQHRRFRREIEKFARIWNLTASVSDPAAGTEPAARWQVETRGLNWSTTTDYEVLDWQDLVRAEIARPTMVQLAQGLVAYGDFIFSGTAARYFRAAWPYGVFFAVPLLNVVWFGAAAILAGIFVARALADDGQATAAAAGLAGAAAVFAILMRTLGRRWRVGQALADWIFAREFMYGRRPALDARIDVFAQRVIAAVRSGAHDEILVAGHSLGATIAVLILARALDVDSSLVRSGPRICLLTVGSTIPKLALHPAADALRTCARKVAGEAGIAWVEYQARRDAISFYKFDPVRLTRFTSNAANQKPLIQLIGLKELMLPETYARNWLRQMRLHYQFVMANERRARYDYFMFVSGPAGFQQLTQSPEGPLLLFGADGAFLAGQGAS
jgi:hypothetical protein